MKKIIHHLFYLGLLAFPLAGQSELVLHTDAIEGRIQIEINQSLDGDITIKRCPGCPVLKLKIDKHTAAKKNGKSVHLFQARHANGKFGVIGFNPKTKRVTQIVW